MGAEEDLQGARFWLLHIVIRGRYGRWLTGVALFAALFSLFGIADAATAQGASRLGLGVALFFPLILAYIVPIHQLIIARSLAALGSLAECFPDLSSEIEYCRRRLTVKSRAWIGRTLAIGLAAGIGHNALLLAGNGLAAAVTHPPTLLTMILTGIVWIVMTAAISSLVENAVLFARLGTRVPIEPLRLRQLTPFGSVAVSSTLAMIGAQAAFPFLFAEADVSYVTYVPGLVATAAPMVYLFAAPVWPVHRRIVQAKQSEIERLDRMLATEQQAPDKATAYAELAPLLIYRRELLASGEWPFDTSVMGRLALYLIIPPLTWVGAALIEMLLDTAL